jgi:hypothetical protein
MTAGPPPSVMNPTTSLNPMTAGFFGGNSPMMTGGGGRPMAGGMGVGPMMGGNPSNIMPGKIGGVGVGSAGSYDPFSALNNNSNNNNNPRGPPNQYINRPNNNSNIRR